MMAQAAMAVAQQRQEEYTNCQWQPAHQFHVGDKVWLNLKNITTDRPCKKFDWIHAKYTVTRVVSSHVYELNVPRQIHRRFHVSLLRPAATNPFPSQHQMDYQPPVVLSIREGEGDEYAVEEIIAARTHHHQHQVLVKWVG